MTKDKAYKLYNEYNLLYVGKPYIDPTTKIEYLIQSLSIIVTNLDEQDESKKNYEVMCYFDELKKIRKTLSEMILHYANLQN